MDDKSKKQEIVVRIICVVLSFGLWLYISNVENNTKEYKMDKVPVDISNVDVLKDYKLAVVPNQNFYVTLNLEGPQSDIYKVRRDQFKIVLNLNNYVLKKGENNIPVEVVNSPLNINIKNNGLLRVRIILDDYVEKSMPIKADIKITAKQSVYAQTPQIKPQSALVTGSKEYVDKVKSLSVVGEVKNAEKDMEISLPVVALDDNGETVKDVKVDPGNANVNISVNRGRMIPINIVTKGEIKDGLLVSSIVANPDRVEIIGLDKDLENIKYIDTDPVDLTKITESSEVTIAVKIPENLKSTLTNNQVKVKVNLNKLVTKEFTVPINIKLIDEGLNASIEPQKVVITLKGTEESFVNIKGEDLKAELNLQDKKEGEYTLAPTLTNPYDNLKLVSIIPDKIKTIIVKK